MYLIIETFYHHIIWGLLKMEITIYNIQGKPCAYITMDEDNTIYLWDGHPVAYIKLDSIIGFNGKQLGWFYRKTMYDKDGFRIGFTKISCPSPVQNEPEKSSKKVKPEKKMKEKSLNKPHLFT